MQLAIYADMPAANTSFAEASEVMAEIGVSSVGSDAGRPSDPLDQRANGPRFRSRPRSL